MKKLFTLMLAVAAMISFTACEKDGGDDSQNILQVNNKNYTLGACIFYIYENEEYDCYDFYLTDKKYWGNDGMWPEENIIYANGKEVNIYDLRAPKTEKGTLVPGKYTYSTEWEDFKHDGCSNYVIYDEAGEHKGLIEFGQDEIATSNLEIEIKHIEGKIYEITFKGGIDQYGNTIKGYYKGTVDMFYPNDWK